MAEDAQVDPTRWLDAIDASHECEHKPNGEEQC
jgi:hypothetical protein